MTEPLHSRFNRTAKYFMDNGRAQTAEEAMGLLESFGLTIAVGPEIRSSPAAQIALLTLVNLARRTFLGGVHVVGPLDVPVLVPLSLQPSLADAVLDLGGHVSEMAKPRCPVAMIGTADVTASGSPVWCMTWEGWRGGVVPSDEGWRLADDEQVPLAPALAAAICAAEVFAYHAGDHPMAGKRAAGFSLWQPGSDWTIGDLGEPDLSFLPSKLWLIGLGNLGQAYAWLLATLPYPRGGLELVLQDDDRLVESNDSTSVLTRLDMLGQMKTRMVAAWLEDRGFATFLEERRYGHWTRRQQHEPGVALCGVDNPIARAALEDGGFGLVVESGLGAGPQSFRNVAMHVFPGARTAKAIWPSTVMAGGPNVSHMPAYAALKERGLDACGLAQLASRTVGVPFVGIFAGVLVISELLRRLHGGLAMDVLAGALTCLDDVEGGVAVGGTYEHGYVVVSK
ncbi:hypothetical protein [Brevundimonas subvibrioides]|uniref:hypothetical protein n=1 Tax=Brevundimonas subvibrioides TaxID=74313 RepID=UPI0022B54EFD|nr:hypothetical protein [Brevundimonas subvibrioides]